MLKFISKEALPKLNSDRLWMLLLYFAVLISNAKWGLGLTEKQLTELLYAVIAFILGKSVRGTTAGNLLGSLVPTLTTAADALMDGDDPTDEKKKKRDKPES